MGKQSQLKGITSAVNCGSNYMVCHHQTVMGC